MKRVIVLWGFDAHQLQEPHGCPETEGAKENWVPWNTEMQDTENLFWAKMMQGIVQKPYDGIPGKLRTYVPSFQSRQGSSSNPYCWENNISRGPLGWSPCFQQVLWVSPDPTCSNKEKIFNIFCFSWLKPVIRLCSKAQNALGLWPSSNHSRHSLPGALSRPQLSQLMENS